MLKKAKKKVPFADIDLTLSPDKIKKSPTNRMRDIDTFRLHVPPEEERSDFKIPESMDRINIHDHKNVMVLCGGHVGLHFTSQEISDIMRLTGELERAFRTLEDYFSKLPNTSKRYCLKDNTTPAVPVAVDNSVQPPPPPESQQDQACVEEVMTFHTLADAVEDILRETQDLVRRKQCQAREIPRGESLSVDPNCAEADERLESLPRPLWIETLSRKFYTHTSPDSDNISQAAASVPPVGKFAAFLSCCLTHQVDCTASEYRALLELVLASSDQYGQRGSIANIEDEIFSHTQKYWASRFFQFIRKLPEFKTALKDEKSLYLFNQFIQ